MNGKASVSHALVLLASRVGCSALAAPTAEEDLPLRYFDANGKFVGRVYGGQIPHAVLRIGSDLVAVPVGHKAGFRFEEWLYYGTIDCTGTAFARARDVYGIRQGTVVSLPGDRVGLFLAMNGERLNLARGSRQDPNRLQKCKQLQPGKVLRLEDTPIDITGQFQGPFSIM